MFETAPNSFQMTVEPIAIRGPRLSLTRVCYRDTDDADWPIKVELLQMTEVSHGGLMHETVTFDPSDINGAFAELTARWIGSGDVAHPEVIEAVCRLTESINRPDWDVFATLTAGATHVNHRQLSDPDAPTFADHMSSIRMAEALIPDFRTELAEVLGLSARGLVGHGVVTGTSTDGVAVEIPLIQLVLFDGERVTHVEDFDPSQRDLALARFEELNQRGELPRA